MNTDNVSEFFRAVITDDYLQAQIDNADWSAEQIILLAAKQGYFFTQEQLLAFLLERYQEGKSQFKGEY